MLRDDDGFQLVSLTKMSDANKRINDAIKLLNEALNSMKIGHVAAPRKNVKAALDILKGPK